MKKGNTVCVRCFTYNQASYIEEAMDGFCMQETTFPFVCVIVDDASTDGEQEIIKNYLQTNFDLNDETVVRHDETTDYYLTYAQHKSNRNCFFAVLLLKYNHYQIKKSKLPYIKEWTDNAEYAALCEGDDYWIDPLKLQKQYNVLEKNADIDMCAHSVSVLYKDKIIDSIAPSKNERILTTEEVIKGGGAFISTNSLFYRESLLKQKCRMRERLSLDYTLQIMGSLRGGIWFIPDNMAVYRRFSEGSWTSKIRFDTSRIVQHRKSVIEALTLLDEDTNGLYSTTINEKIKNLSFIALCLEFNLKEIRKDEYRQQYNSLSLRSKLYLRFGYLFPRIARYIKQHLTSDSL